MEKEVQKDRERQGLKNGGNVYSVGERLGATLEILTYSVIFSHVSWHGEKSWNKRMMRKDRRGDDHCQYLGRYIWYVWIILHIRSL